MNKIKTLTLNGTQYDIVDEKAREDIANIKLTLGSSIVGMVDDNNNIILSGTLTDGTYMIGYENKDGSITEIGTITIGDNSELSNYLTTQGRVAIGDDNKIYHNSSESTYITLYSDSTNVSIYNSSALTDYSSVKPIAVPNGVTSATINLPNTIDVPLRVNAAGMTFDTQNNCYIKSHLSGFTEYGTLKVNIPADSTYVLFEINGQGYPNMTEYDLSNCSISWE